MITLTLSGFPLDFEIEGTFSNRPSWISPEKTYKFKMSVEAILMHFETIFACATQLIFQALAVSNLGYDSYFQRVLSTMFHKCLLLVLIMLALHQLNPDGTWGIVVFECHTCIFLVRKSIDNKRFVKGMTFQFAVFVGSHACVA